MIPVPIDASRTDIDQWCNRCVVMYRKPDGTSVPCWYQGMIDTDTRRLLVRDLLTAESYTIRVGDMFVNWPMCGSINLASGYAIHAARNTVRQYRRSFSTSLLNYIIPRLWDVAKSKRLCPEMMQPDQEEVAKACFFPEYPSVEEAYRLIMTGERVTVALNRSVIVAGDASGKRFFYYNGELVASALNGTLYPSGDVRGLQRAMKSVGGLVNAA